MKSYEASAMIQAAPSRVWEILVDGSNYTTWDSGVERLDGTIASGEKIKVVSKANPGRAFPVTITEFVPNQTMRWSGGMPLGLFKGERKFTLAPAAGGTSFTMREEYTGLMLPLIWRSMPDLQPSFDQFAAGLKQRAENTG